MLKGLVQTGRGRSALQGAPAPQPVRHEDRVHRRRGPPRALLPETILGRPSNAPGLPRWPYEPDATTDRTAEEVREAATPRCPAAMPAQLLRVDLTKRQGAGPSRGGPRTMRESARRHRPGLAHPLQGDVARAKGNVSWDHPGQPARSWPPGRWRGCRCGARAGSPSSRSGRMTNGPTSTQANGFFGTELKYSRLRRHRHPGPGEGLGLSLHQRRRGRAARRAPTGRQGHVGDAGRARAPSSGSRGHQLSVYSIGPAGENLRALRRDPGRLRPRRVQERRAAP